MADGAIGAAASGALREAAADLEVGAADGAEPGLRRRRAGCPHVDLGRRAPARVARARLRDLPRVLRRRLGRSRASRLLASSSPRPWRAVSPRSHVDRSPPEGRRRLLVRHDVRRDGERLHVPRRRPVRDAVDVGLLTRAPAAELGARALAAGRARHRVDHAGAGRVGRRPRRRGRRGTSAPRSRRSGARTAAPSTRPSPRSRGSRST